MTFNIYELIIFIATISTVAILAVNNIRLYFSNKKLMESLIQSTLEKLNLQDALDKLANEYDLISMQESDGFVKFLSDSRESAFSYIEEVQQSIKQLSLAMDSDSEDAIKVAYTTLLKYLPKEELND